MKRFLIVALSGFFALMIGVNSTLARPDYSKQFQECVKETKVAEAAKEAKCAVCHHGKSKKNRNDFGVALNKCLTAETYKELKSDKEALKEKILEAFKVVMKQKSKAKGKAFGELIKAGELPGTAPEVEE